MNNLQQATPYSIPVQGMPGQQTRFLVDALDVRASTAKTDRGIEGMHV